MIDDVNVQVWL